MIGIIIPLVKSAAGMLLSGSAKSLATSKKTNDIVSIISNQFSGMNGDEDQSGSLEDKVGGGKAYNVNKTNEE